MPWQCAFPHCRRSNLRRPLRRNPHQRLRPSSPRKPPLHRRLQDSKLLPAGAFQLGGDAGMHRYIGGAPPAGSGIHDYYITVTALDVAKTGLGPSASGAFLGFNIAGIVSPTIFGQLADRGYTTSPQSSASTGQFK